jgi:hypothetical protein
VRAATKDDEARTRIDDALRNLLPTGITPDDSKRWSKEWGRYHYSFDAARMVPKR